MKIVRRPLVGALRVGLLTYALVVAMLFAFQRSLFFPSPAPRGLPSTGEGDPGPRARHGPGTPH